MVVVVIVAILMLYFILAAQFESLTLPIILLVEIPLDVAFTILILWLSGISPQFDVHDRYRGDEWYRDQRFDP